MDMKKVGNQITVLRKNKGLTQNDLGERIGVTFQAVSKWERGETLPETSLLPDLARVLETTVDFILSGGEPAVGYRGKISLSDMAEGIRCLDAMGRHLGRENLIYRAAVEGINSRMQTDIEQCFSDDYAFEAFLAEAVIQNLMAGAYIDVTEVRHGFRHEHFREIVLKFCERHGIR